MILINIINPPKTASHKDIKGFAVRHPNPEQKSKYILQITMLVIELINAISLIKQVTILNRVEEHLNAPEHFLKRQMAPLKRVMHNIAKKLGISA